MAENWQETVSLKNSDFINFILNRLKCMNNFSQNQKWQRNFCASLHLDTCMIFSQLPWERLDGVKDYSKVRSSIQKHTRIKIVNLSSWLRLLLWSRWWLERRLISNLQWSLLDNRLIRQMYFCKICLELQQLELILGHMCNKSLEVVKRKMMVLQRLRLQLKSKLDKKQQLLKKLKKKQQKKRKSVEQRKRKRELNKLKMRKDNAENTRSKKKKEWCKNKWKLKDNWNFKINNKEHK